MNVRALAAQALVPVLNRQASLSSTLPPAQQRCAARDRALLHNLVYGTAREWLYFQTLIKPLCHKPIKNPLVLALLGLGLYQLLRTRIPAHAAIAETVEAARSLGQASATGLINALLRRFANEQEARCLAAKQFNHAHPEWLRLQLRRDWPEAFAQIIAANNQPAPLTLRINPRFVSREAYLALLHEAGVAANACRYADNGIQLENLHEVTELPHYAEGWFSVQDESAQLAAQLLSPAPNSRVLDACAAPGGKTAHLLEIAQPKSLLALDSDPQRLKRVHENLQRLQLLNDKVHIQAADASDVDSWAAGLCFDAILLDAPCTAVGVIRRHPDIKLLRQESDVTQTVSLQAQILRALWPLLAEGGRLLYATCSVFKAENEQQIATFLAETANAHEVLIDATWGEQRPHGRQLFPQIEGGDGFYYALLEKVSS